MAVDGVTIGGDGTTASPLTVLSVIDKYYLANEPYQLNKVVHADAGEIGIMAGIYKLLTEHERVWQPYYPKRLMPGIAQTFNPGDYFYINNLGAPYEHYNGIYWVNDDVTHVGIAILITQTDVHDLEDHLIAGNVVQMTTASGPMYPWQPNHQYGLADLVIGKYVPDAATGVFVPDYSVFYERIVPDSANPLDWQHEFSEFNDVLGWKLLADISGSMIGIIQTGMSVGYPWTDVADPIPIGYLHCAGQAVSKSMYVDLYAIIGDTYGSSASTFNLPTAYNFIIKF